MMVMIVVMIVAMIVAMIVVMIVMMIVVMIDPDVKLDRRDAAAVDFIDREGEAVDPKTGDLPFEKLKVEAKVEHRADEHIAADAREAVEIEGSCHGYSKVPATTVVATSGWRYLRMA